MSCHISKNDYSYASNWLNNFTRKDTFYCPSRFSNNGENIDSIAYLFVQVLDLFSFQNLNFELPEFPILVLLVK